MLSVKSEGSCPRDPSRPVLHQLTLTPAGNAAGCQQLPSAAAGPGYRRLGASAGPGCQRLGASAGPGCQRLGGAARLCHGLSARGAFTRLRWLSAPSQVLPVCRASARSGSTKQVSPWLKQRFKLIVTICRDILSTLARAFGKRFWPAQS